MTVGEFQAIEKRCLAAKAANTDPRQSTALDVFHQHAIDDITKLLTFCRKLMVDWDS